MTIKKKRVAHIPVQISVNFFNSSSFTYSGEVRGKEKGGGEVVSREGYVGWGEGGRGMYM